MYGRISIAVIIAAATLHCLLPHSAVSAEPPAAAPVWLGVLLADVPPETAEKLDLGSTGVLVVDVTPGGPAHRAGLRKGDVVVAVAGRRLNTPADLRPLLAAASPGDRLAIELLRSAPDCSRADRLHTQATLELPPKLAAPDLRDMINAAERAMDEGRLKEAEALFARALARFEGPAPVRARLYVLRGMAAAKQDKLRAALDDFNKAVDLDPDESRAYYSRALALGKLERYAQAVEDFTAAIRLTPQDALAHFYRGNTYMHLNQPKLAIADYEAALKLRPDDERFQQTLAAARRQLDAAPPAPPADQPPAAPKDELILD